MVIVKVPCVTVALRHGHALAFNQFFQRFHRLGAGCDGLKVIPLNVVTAIAQL